MSFPGLLITFSKHVNIKKEVGCDLLKDFSIGIRLAKKNSGISSGGTLLRVLSKGEAFQSCSFWMTRR